MSGDDGFTFVKYKHPRKNKHKSLGFFEEFSCSKSQTSVKQLDVLINCICQCKVELKSSTFYKELLGSLSQILSPDKAANSGEVSLNFQDCVSYGIGRISECPIARYQFALLVLLWQHFRPAGKCYIYDPVFGNLDQQIIKHFELELIPRNEEAKRCVAQKTLFFVPHCGKPIYNNILWANWGVGLENVIIFGNSFASYQERLPLRQLKSEASYIAEILSMTHEVKLQIFTNHDDIFNDTSLHYWVADELHKKSSSFWSNYEEPVYQESSEIILDKY
ncbi:SRR1-like protein [Dendronephthya gigantea]|uniref:SRR1-like protein n=1 Tax=Dendronephthya gigantea TaxID=151771 RepID=UPI00106CA67B|nr:SRR1-like protein [Dendronephthya gigantea]